MAVSDEHSVRVSKPGSGSSLRVDVQPGQELELGFFTDEVLFEIAGPDLQLNFDDGALVILAGFFPAMEKGDCTVALPDGTEVSGQMISESLTTSWENFHTNAPDRGDEAPEPATEAGHLFLLSDDPSGLLCHDSCGLFDESVHLPGAPDPLFTPRPAPAAPPPDATFSPPGAPRSDGAGRDFLADLNERGPQAPDLNATHVPWTRAGDAVLRFEDLLDSAGQTPPAFGPERTFLPAEECRAAPSFQPPEALTASAPGTDEDWQLALLRLGELAF